MRGGFFVGCRVGGGIFRLVRKGRMRGRSGWAFGRAAILCYICPVTFPAGWGGEKRIAYDS